MRSSIFILQAEDQDEALRGLARLDYAISVYPDGENSIICINQYMTTEEVRGKLRSLFQSYTLVEFTGTIKLYRVEHNAAITFATIQIEFAEIT